MIDIDKQLTEKFPFINKSIDELFKLILPPRTCPTNVRFALFSDTAEISIEGPNTRGRDSNGRNPPPFEFIREFSANRGGILEVFAKMEYLTNQIIRFSISKKIAQDPILEEIIESVPFYRRIKILEESKVIDGDTAKLMKNFIRVRNKFAHVWNDYEIKYGDARISNNFSRFREDFERAWKGLLLAYYKKIEAEKIVEEIKKRAVDVSKRAKE